MENRVILFEDKKDCCGCGACMNACPKQAIDMITDEYGFTYPQINQDECIQCGACKRVCGYQNISPSIIPQKVYAVAAKDDSTIKNAASGGVFAVISKYYIKKSGVVYGVSMENEGGKLFPKHIRVTSENGIESLQGSKYVQSDMGTIYGSIREDLQAGKEVLFSGTPCQVAGVKKFLGKEYDNFCSIEIICHGVPGRKMFQDFIDLYGKKLGGQIKEFYFRDKSKGQGYVTRTIFEDSLKRKKEVIKLGGLLSYVHFFSKSYILRKNCYSCPFAQDKRFADITVGDYWGFHVEHPEIRKTSGLSNDRGVSCLLINSDKAANVLENCKDHLFILESDYEKILKHNEQLNGPSKYSIERENILKEYQQGGYKGVEKFFMKHCLVSRMKCRISGMLSKDFKRKVRNIIVKVKA